MKMLCRGGITRGLVHHDNQVIFGPAMIEAYQIERERAKYPRIILSEEVARFGISAEPPVDKVFSRFVRKDDEDGYYFVNTLRVLRMIMDWENDPQDDIRQMCEEIDNYLINELYRFSQDEKDKKERKKIEWFKNYFDWARDRSGREISKKPYPRGFR